MFTETPFKLIKSSLNDAFVDKIDASNYEKSIQSQFKNAWHSFANFFGPEEGQQSPEPIKREPITKKDQIEKNKDFIIKTYESLLYAKSKSHGVTIKTMTKVDYDNM